MLNKFIDAFHADVNESNCPDVNCSPNAACTSSNGNFYCTCVQGYSGDGFVCFGKSSTSYQYQSLKVKTNFNGDSLLLKFGIYDG